MHQYGMGGLEKGYDYRLGLSGLDMSSDEVAPGFGFECVYPRKASRGALINERLQKWHCGLQRRALGIIQISGSMLYQDQNSTPFVLGTSPSLPATGLHAILNATASALNALSAL